jgi:hypothetical protein
VHSKTSLKYHICCIHRKVSLYAPTWVTAVNTQLVTRTPFLYQIYMFWEEDGSWKKLHNDEFHNLYSSPNIVRVIKSKRMRWAGYVVGRPEGKRPLGRPRRWWEDNIKMVLREI